MKPPGKEHSTERAQATDAARSAGRGGLAIAVAKVSFIVFGFIQQLILPRLLGVDGYGEVSRVLAVVGVINNVVVATSIQGVSRAVSSVPEHQAAEAFRKTLTVHAALALSISTAFALLAGQLASFIGAPHIATPLRLVSAVVLLYGVYAPLVGSLNGRRRFLTQAGLDIGYGAMRTLGIAVGAVLFLRLGGSGVVGAIAGFVAAAAIIVPVALTRSGVGARGAAGPSSRSYLGYLLPLMLGQICLNLLLQTDFALLSRFVGQGADHAGLGPGSADELVGVYRGVQLFAFLPYQMLMSVSFILFPMLARASAEGDHEKVRQFIATGVRIALLLTGLMSSTVAGLGPHVLRFAFPVVIAEKGGDALRLLSLGMGSFAILGILCTAFTSLAQGREWITTGLTALTVCFVAAGCFVLVPSAPFGPAMLERSAVAATIALTASAAVGGLILFRIAGAFVRLLTLLRVLTAIGVTLLLGMRLPWFGKLAVPLEAFLLACVYLGVLFITRELSSSDLNRVKASFGRRKANPSA